MKPALIFTLMVCATGFSSPVIAQSADYDMEHTSQSVEARIGMKIPIGGDYKKANTKPQIALGLRSEGFRGRSGDWALRANTPWRETREFKLALTLEPAPSLLLNDQVLSLGNKVIVPDGKLNAMDTYDKTVLTVIGVSLAVIAGTLIIVADD